MLKLARYLKKYRLQVILGPAFKLVEAVFELIVPLVMAKIIDIGVKNSDTAYVLKMGGVLLLLGVVGLCSTLVCQRFASVASQGFGTTVRNELFEQINSFSHSELDKFGTPSLITRLTNDVNQLQYAVAMLIRLVVRAPFLAIGAIIMAMSIDLKLSLIFLAATPLIAIVTYIIMGRSIPFFKVMQKRLDKLSLVTREGLEGARVIRAFSRQQDEEKRFGEASSEQAKTAVSVGRISALLNPLTAVIMNLAIVAIIWFGGKRVYLGALTQGEVIAFVNYINQILLALIVVANLVVTFTKAAASAARVNEVFETSPAVTEGTLTELDAGASPLIEFKNVSFSYDIGGENELSSVSFCVNAGETIGVIGGTGSGKSTLVNLIPRYYDAGNGEVLIAGRNVKDYTFDALRNAIGVVPQNVELFSGTIRDNMKWGNENAGDDEIFAAMKTAQAFEFVDKLPQKLSAPVAQGGKNFSGGQRQRLTIARAIVRKPKILILDDSASALDYATDSLLRKALKHDLKGTAVIMVSQRASTIKNADKIIVLDNGCPVGIGRHDELFESCEVYREICLSQISAEEAKKNG